MEEPMRIAIFVSTPIYEAGTRTDAIINNTDLHPHNWNGRGKTPDICKGIV